MADVRQEAGLLLAYMQVHQIHDAYYSGTTTGEGLKGVDGFGFDHGWTKVDGYCMVIIIGSCLACGRQFSFPCITRC